jgi:lipoate-protein ligase A
VAAQSRYTAILKGIIAKVANWPWIESTLADPGDNLRFEEELLRRADAANHPQGILLTWESRQECVVLGRSEKPERAVDLDACHCSGVPVLRRCSGGGAVLLGPGCLNYALVLPFECEPRWREVRYSLIWALDRVREALGVVGLECLGQSDLALGGRKVSGSAQRRGRNAFLHHGTLLYDFDASRVERFIQPPLREPAYRRRRRHHEFLGNLPLVAEELKQRLARGLLAGY